jgi:hypothetical protein
MDAQDIRPRKLVEEGQIVQRKNSFFAKEMRNVYHPASFEDNDSLHLNSAAVQQVIAHHALSDP